MEGLRRVGEEEVKAGCREEERTQNFPGASPTGASDFSGSRVLASTPASRAVEQAGTTPFSSSPPAKTGDEAAVVKASRKIGWAKESRPGAAKSGEPSTATEATSPAVTSSPLDSSRTSVEQTSQTLTAALEGISSSPPAQSISATARHALDAVKGYLPPAMGGQSPTTNVPPFEVLDVSNEEGKKEAREAAGVAEIEPEDARVFAAEEQDRSAAAKEEHPATVVSDEAAHPISELKRSFIGPVRPDEPTRRSTLTTAAPSVSSPAAPAAADTSSGPGAHDWAAEEAVAAVSAAKETDEGGAEKAKESPSSLRETSSSSTSSSAQSKSLEALTTRETASQKAGEAHERRTGEKEGPRESQRSTGVDLSRLRGDSAPGIYVSPYTSVPAGSAGYKALAGGGVSKADTVAGTTQTSHTGGAEWMQQQQQQSSSGSHSPLSAVHYHAPDQPHPASSRQHATGEHQRARFTSQRSFDYPCPGRLPSKEARRLAHEESQVGAPAEAEKNPHRSTVKEKVLGALHLGGESRHDHDWQRS
ncbi:hypothetical protein JCM10213v2_004106 [Rhodosporidiobolus nylandii]